MQVGLRAQARNRPVRGRKRDLVRLDAGVVATLARRRGRWPIRLTFSSARRLSTNSNAYRHRDALIALQGTCVFKGREQNWQSLSHTIMGYGNTLLAGTVELPAAGVMARETTDIPFRRARNHCKPLRKWRWHEYPLASKTRFQAILGALAWVLWARANPGASPARDQKSR